jgi:hypothetical protein
MPQQKTPAISILVRNVQKIRNASG